MVFHEIDSITDVISGNRIIVYYIGGTFETNSNEALLCRHLDLTLEMLEKKNDDLLIIKILKDSHQFEQLNVLYKPHIDGVVTLFIVNNEGIPIMCNSISQENNVPQVIQNVCKTCNLNQIPNIEFFKHSNSIKSHVSDLNTTSLPITKNKSMESDDFVEPQLILYQERVVNTSLLEQNDILATKNSSPTIDISRNLKAYLQIRLPNGNKDTREFGTDNNLKEVWHYINSKHKLKDFDLKTYNRQVFSEDDYQKTLQDLDLCPNGVIIVVHKNIVSNNNGGIHSVIQNSFGLLRNKTLSLFYYMHGMLLIFWNSFFSTNNGGNGPRQRRISSSKTDNGQASRPTHKQPKKSTYGNIHTLHSRDDSDDENNRYNGNSTQQK